MPAPRVRAIVLNYNRADLTLGCVESLLAQDFPSLDVLVVDNRSADADYERLTSSLPTRVALVRAAANGGYAKGNNLGARYAGLPRPDYTLFVNNDVLLRDSSTVRKLVEALEESPCRAAASPLVHTLSTNLPPEQQPQVRRVPGFLGVLAGSSPWLRRLPMLRPVVADYMYEDVRPYSADSVLDCETVNGSCFLIRTGVLERIGFLDEGTFLFYEEIILGKQLQLERLTASLVTTTMIEHYQGAATGQRAGRVRWSSSLAMARSEMYYCRRYLSTSPAGLALLGLVRLVDFGLRWVFAPMLIKGA